MMRYYKLIYDYEQDDNYVVSQAKYLAMEK